MMYSPRCGAGSLCLNSIESLLNLFFAYPCFTSDMILGFCLVFFLNCININKGMVLLSETATSVIKDLLFCSSCKHVAGGTPKLVQNGLFF